MNSSMFNKSNATSSIGENIYHYLRKGIIELKLKPGDSLSAKNIAEQLEVSRSPVRDSIIKLGKEGLVDIVAQSGTTVSKIDLDRVAEEQFIRFSLEEKVMMLFIEKSSSREISKLEELMEMQKANLEKKEYNTFLNYDDEFHSVFFETANKQMSWELIVSMSGHYRRLRLITLWDLEIAEDVMKQHYDLLKFIKEKNIDMARKTVQEHTMRIFAQKDFMVKKYPTFFKEKNDEIDLFNNFKR
ncbi:DNA-binding GntR family transcriptional regulator [Natranaerovirga hydrolytica]|uniref:DNA-binding GntR family transcriptional regulator n=1 Tax=Natranaerovirga hydrolytica TaxID=680378 RepID=A0A4R1MQD1_9FIRM|nr:GntR family transcriptional regulator [Natranaerovirga hydrolytica]TCK92739.1 DNA-binding GntR family transcriptional regulator [Natranaerovirga hydrolytica]